MPPFVAKLKSAHGELSDKLAEELRSVPAPRKTNAKQKDTISAVLDLNSVTRALMEAHIAAVGLDKYYFKHTIEDQSKNDRS